MKISASCYLEQKRNQDQGKSPRTFTTATLDSEAAVITFKDKDSSATKEFKIDSHLKGLFGAILCLSLASVSKKRPVLLLVVENAQFIVEFISRTEQDDSFNVRDQFKEAIAAILRNEQLLPPAEQEAVSEDDVKLRGMILESNPRLAKLFQALVLGGYLSEKEFWSTRSDLLDRQNFESKQKIGLSNELLHEVRPTASVGNDAKYTLTPAIIESIFLHHPKVLQLHQENVPKKLSEQEFWSRYFQSSFFYKDKPNKKDSLFETAALEEEKELLSNRMNLSTGFLVDLGDADYKVEVNGGNKDLTMVPNSNLSLIKKLNKHGEIVVSTYAGGNNPEKGSVPRHKQVLRNIMDLEDLRSPQASKLKILKISDHSLYSNSGTMDYELGSSNNSTKDWGSVCEQVKQGFRLTNKKAFAETAMSVLQELVEDSNIPNEFDAKYDHLSELQTLHMNVHEILKHFWSSFPPDSSQSKKSKFSRMSQLLDTADVRLREYLSRDDSALLQSAFVALSKAKFERDRYLNEYR